jgi:hypothetical protein
LLQIDQTLMEAKNNELLQDIEGIDNNLIKMLNQAT